MVFAARRILDQKKVELCGVPDLLAVLSTPSTTYDLLPAIRPCPPVAKSFFSALCRPFIQFAPLL
jgi:hypothetical protein